jgi:hypothetical protein
MNLYEFSEMSHRREKIEARLARAAFRLEMAGLERLWAIVSARNKEMSVREIAKKVRLVGPNLGASTCLFRTSGEHGRGPFGTSREKNGTDLFPPAWISISEV